MAPPPPPLRIGALLRLAGEHVHDALYRGTAAAGYPELRPAHFRLLRYPGPDGCRPTELADRLGLSKQAIHPLINDLETWGYLDRQADTGDRRGRVLRLTPRGHELLTTIRDLHAQFELDLERRVGEEQVRNMLTTLRAVLGLTDELSPTPSGTEPIPDGG